MSMGNNPNNNSNKQKKLIDIYYALNFSKDHYGKVNLAKNAELEDVKTATQTDYYEQLKDKPTNGVSDVEIVLNEKEQFLRIVNYSSCHYYDMSNQQKGLTNNTAALALATQAQNDRPDTKVVVLFGGDLVGSEWEMRYLNNANLVDKTVMYYGMRKRIEKVVKDIKYARSLGAEVILMRGNEEHRANRALGYDVLQDVVDMVNDEGVHYVHEGVSEIINVTKINEQGKGAYHATIELQSNMPTKSTSAQGNLLAAKKNNGQSNGDITIITTSNASGKLENSVYALSGQAMYQQTVKGKKPNSACKEYNTLELCIEDNHEITVVEGITDFYSRINTKEAILQNACYDKICQNRELATMCKKKIDAKHIELCDNIVSKGLKG